MQFLFYFITRQYSPLNRSALPKSLLMLLPRFAVSLSHKIIREGSMDPEEPPVFILHGLLSGKRNWKSIAKTIGNMTRRTVITVDLRNHGGSPHVNSHKYEDMAADILQLFRRLGTKRASLVGHDMGGRAAMCVSLIAPQKVAGLLIVDISPLSTCSQLKDEYIKILEAMKAVKFKSQKKVYKAKREAKKQLKPIITDDVMMNSILYNINVKGDGVIGWTCNLDILIKYFKHIASFPKSIKGKKYSGPVLFVGGQLSDFLPPEDLNGIREMFPRAVITYIPKTGHNLQVDDPKSFLELAIAFIRTNH
ncbi:hypothetical protein K1T71_011183 [Dendrolimus kikuchii]|uniref:Uncharacterized protein n=1 Tax=Dendrolimus kikuchii TaxID=765133 RepID=A0ACC1CNG4_9NEOP|nr:hypothetical protein K1T71_011183 [Dendrolimus kikuchii]